MMLSSFALHAETDELALLCFDPDRRLRIELRTLDGQPLGVIGPDLLPEGGLWSPDGATLAFYNNDGMLYLYRPGWPAPQPVVADPALQAGFCQWAADGRRLVYSAYGKADRTPPKIYTIDLETRQITQLAHGARTVDRFPQWAPSGRLVAFQRQNLDEPEIPMRVCVVEVASGDCFSASPDWEGKSYVGRRAWSSDSAALLVTEPLEGSSRLRVIRLEDGAATWSYASETLQGGAFSPQGDRILCVCSDELLWFAYPEGSLLARLSLASLSPVRGSFTGPLIEFGTQANAVYFLGIDRRLYRWEFGGEYTVLMQSPQPVSPDYAHESYTVPSRDGRLIPVQRFIPAQRRSPAILFVHGGPGEAIDPDDPFMLRLLAEGVEFVCAAYRGSSGFGEEHQEANRGEYGRADVWDVIAAGLDWKRRVGGDRPLVLAGYSYGAFLSFLALAQANQPFDGGIVLWPVSGMHRLGAHEHRAFPAEADRRAEAVIERSPLAQAWRIRGPLLIFHGALDTSATSEEMQSIRADILSQGGECELVIFSDDTHNLMRHRDEIHASVVAFLKRFE